MSDLKDMASKAVESLQKSTPAIVKDNKGALIGAVIGLLLSDNKKAMSAITGAVAGALLVDNKKKRDGEEDE